MTGPAGDDVGPDAASVAARIGAILPTLPVSLFGDPEGTGWVPLSVLLHEEDVLLDRARTAGEAYGAGADPEAVSLYVQGVTYRLASLWVGAWLVAGGVLDPDPGAVALHHGPYGANGVHLTAPAWAVPAPASVGALRDRLATAALDPLVAGARRVSAVGRAVLWSGIASGWASAFGTCAALPSVGPTRARSSLAMLMDGASGPLAGAGRFLDEGDGGSAGGWRWRRTTCCLWFHSSGGRRCADCPTPADPSSTRPGNDLR